jgi:hypothetical protein
MYLTDIRLRGQENFIAVTAWCLTLGWISLPSKAWAQELVTCVCSVRDTWRSNPLQGGTYQWPTRVFISRPFSAEFLDCTSREMAGKFVTYLGSAGAQIRGDREMSCRRHDTRRAALEDIEKSRIGARRDQSIEVIAWDGR